MPHIHAEYSGEEIVIALSGEIFEGSFPKNKLKLLEAWMEIRRDDLEANWKLLSNGEQFFRIEPLRQGGYRMLQPRLIEVKAMPECMLRLVYETGEVKLFDVTPYISGPWFGELKNSAYFNSVRIIPGGSGIEWANGQDIAPHELYENSISQ